MILRHKSWHVWNEDNLARVKRDEEEHAKEEEEKKAQELERSRSVNSDKLRNKARQQLKVKAKTAGIPLSELFEEGQTLKPEQVSHGALLAEPSTALVAAPDMAAQSRQMTPKSSGHINLFQDEEDRANLLKETTQNKKRKRKEEEPVVPEKVFSQAQLTSTGFRPWYTQGEQEAEQIQRIVQQRKEAAGAKRRIRTTGLAKDMKTMLDPLVNINSLLRESASKSDSANHNDPQLLYHPPPSHIEASMASKNKISKWDQPPAGAALLASPSPCSKTPPPPSSSSQRQPHDASSDSSSSSESDSDSSDDARDRKRKSKKMSKKSSKEKSKKRSKEKRKSKKSKKKKKKKDVKKRAEELAAAKIDAMRRERRERERQEKERTQKILTKRPPIFPVGV